MVTRRALLGIAATLPALLACGVLAWACEPITDALPPDVPDAGLPTSLADAPVGAACEPSAFVSGACYPAPSGTLGVGVCKAGKSACAGGAIACQGAVTPSAEICNGKDDDCNGIVDDVRGTERLAAFEGMPVTCTTGRDGICNFGQLRCEDAGPACVALFPQGRPEACNGLDDDCNGLVDDNLKNPRACRSPTKIGECAVGSYVCTSGALQCLVTAVPIREICNGRDDDCDGVVDNPPDGGTLCPGGICQGVLGCYVYTCPFVLSFDGERFSYETSVGGAGLFGQKVQLETGKRVDFEPMWARLDHAAVDASGTLRAKVLAAEDEIVYFDQASLAVVEHPPGYEVVTSSSMQWQSTLERPDPQEFYALRTAAMRAPVSALWLGAVDVTAALRTLDEVAVAHDVHADNFYEIDFGAVVDPRHARLVIDGWKYKFVRRLAPGVPVDRPHLDVEQKDGTYKRVLPLSTPRGDKKAVVFDLSSVTWPTGRYKMRVYPGTHEAGTAMWYLDRARLVEEPSAPISVRHVDPVRADLAFLGAPTVNDENDYTRPRQVTDDGKGALLPEHLTWGRFTRYGDVRDLLRAPDDRMVVMRRGDGITLRFEGLGKRDPARVAYFLRAELLFKSHKWLESKRATALTENVEPLPLHGMGFYPPSPGAFERDEARARYEEEYETREYVKGDPRWGP